MKKVFLDTNIFLRFLVADNQKQFQECLKLIKLIEEGRLRPYTSGFVLSELNYVLIKVYDKKKEEVLEIIDKINKLRNISLVEKMNTKQAMKLYKKYNIKLGDCFIATQVPKEAILVTYDLDFKKIQGFKTAPPRDLI